MAAPLWGAKESLLAAYPRTASLLSHPSGPRQLAPGLHTPILKQLSPVDFVLHHVGPVQRALVEVEVQGNGVAQPGDQDAVVTPVQVNAADLMAVGEYDERLEGVWGKQGRVRRGARTRQGEGVPGSWPQPQLWDRPHPCTVKGCLCQVGTARGPLSAGRSPPGPGHARQHGPQLHYCCLQEPGEEPPSQAAGAILSALAAHPHTPRLRQLSPSGSSIQPS